VVARRSRARVVVDESTSAGRVGPVPSANATRRRPARHPTIMAFDPASEAPHTGTTIVACEYADGVVLGADTRVSTGASTPARGDELDLLLTRLDRFETCARLATTTTPSTDDDDAS
jgi:hypothetical protein